MMNIRVLFGFISSILFHSIETAVAACSSWRGGRFCDAMTGDISYGC